MENYLVAMGYCRCYAWPMASLHGWGRCGWCGSGILGPMHWLPEAERRIPARPLTEAEINLYVTPIVAEEEWSNPPGGDGGGVPFASQEAPLAPFRKGPAEPPFEGER